MFSFLSNKWFHVGIVAAAAAAVAGMKAAGVDAPLLDALIALVAGSSGATAVHLHNAD